MLNLRALVGLLVLLLCSWLPAQWAERCLQAGDVSATWPSPGEVGAAVSQWQPTPTTVQVDGIAFAVQPTPTCGDQFLDTGSYVPLFVWGFPYNGNPVCQSYAWWGGNWGAGFVDPGSWTVVFPSSSSAVTYLPHPPCGGVDTVQTDEFLSSWTYTPSPSTFGLQMVMQAVRYDGVDYWLSNAWEGFLL